MAKIVLEHSDFTLEIESVKYVHLLAKARGNGLDNEALVSRWSWSAGVESVSFTNEQDETEVIWRAGNETFPHVPFFFDNAVQDVWVELKAGCTNIGRPELRHLDANSRFKVRANSLFGPLEFGNDIGRSDFSFAYCREGVPQRFTVSFDVLSTKLDYHRHWKKIVNDVESEYRMLAYDFLKRTYHMIKEDPEGETSDMIWWNVFREERESFLTACRLILNRPKTRHRQLEEWRRADQLRRIDPQLENEIAEHRSDPFRLYRVMVDDDSRDTPENRFFKFAVETVATRHSLLAARVREAAVKRAANAAFLREIDETEFELGEIRANPFFRGIGRFEGFKQVSLVLQQGVGYADVLRIFGVLTAFYSLHDGLFSLETKDIAELYEIWCFIEVKNRVASLLQVAPKDVKHISRGELGELFGTDMRTGKKSRILIEKGDTRLELFYNPKSVENGESGIEGTETPTGGTQKPDIVLQLVRQYDGQASFRLTYLFDAKYRLDEKEHGVDTPPEDAINQMHRYRDAIYYRDKSDPNEQLKKEVIGGYILFPGCGRDEDIRKAYFYRSIDQVNIGALPLRPGNESNGKMLEDFISHLIHKDTRAHIEETNPPKGGILPIATARLVAKTTIYGTYHGKLQLAWIQREGLYNLPKTNAIALGIDSDDEAQKQRLLALLPPGRKPTDPLQVHRVYEYLGEVDRDELKAHYTYPGEAKRGPYLLWKIAKNPVAQEQLDALTITWDEGCPPQNITASSADLIFIAKMPKRGVTLLAERECQDKLKPQKVIDLSLPHAQEEADRFLLQFFRSEHAYPFVLNIVPPPEFKSDEGIQERVREIVEHLKTIV